MNYKLRSGSNYLVLRMTAAVFLPGTVRDTKR